MKATLLGLLVTTTMVLGSVPHAATAAPRPTRDDSSPARVEVSPDNLWQVVDAKSVEATASDFKVESGLFGVYQLDQRALASALAGAPLEGTDLAKSVERRVALPMPDGTFEHFRFVESPIMEQGLADKFPEIKTYLGQGIDDPTATLRFDVTPAGFHAQILAAGRTVYVDPYVRGDSSLYISYDKRGLSREGKPFNCLVGGTEVDLAEQEEAFKGLTQLSSGGTLRTYRLAVASTIEYTNYHGGTVAGGQAAIVTTVNRVNGIYEREIAARLVLVANNNLLVATNATGDNYSNDDGGAMLSQNQTNINSKIGSANYDIGHVVSTGGGGVAYLQSVCKTNKAGGVTGSPAPIGDAFDVDYVAHEMGHQFGGNHTFNSTVGSCGGGNKNTSTAYEVGSGTTIQAYAGICGADNVQPNSDPYFHAISFEEMYGYTTGGGSCGTQSSTGNTPPTVSAGVAYTIPQGTPFTLTASGSDPNGDALTYCWEQFNLGTSSTTKPLFRSLSPTTSSSRTFPKMATILANTTDRWEELPTVNRSMVFRVTARDNRAGGGGVQNSSTTITVSGTPFSVSSPNTAVSWAGGSSQTVTWTVGGGSVAANVNILLSTDGGATFSTVLAGTPNDGSQAITVPSTVSTQCRVKVEGAGNIFFDVSNVNFSITSGGGGTAPAAPSGLTATAASASAINLAWADNSSNETGFKVERKTGAGAFGEIATVGAGVTSYADSGLAASTAYTYRVRATNATGDSGYTNEASATTTGGPGCSSSSTALTTAGGSGSLASTDCLSTVRTGGMYYDSFTFTAAAGTQYTITMNASFDTYLHLLNPSGASVAADDDGNGGTNSKIVYTAAVSGTHTVHATSYTAGNTGAYTITFAGGSTPPGGELVTNGGFESGTASWTFATYSSVTAGAPQEGANKAQMLGRGVTTSTNFLQAIAGFGGTSKTLRFYLKMTSAEGTGTAYDKLTPRILNSAGTVVANLATYSNVNKNTYAGWTLVTLTIPASAAVSGNRLSFLATEDSSLQTTFFIDGVSIQ